MSLSQVLAEAGVSRNAYYSLLRKESILPKSVHAIAALLEVEPSAFLETLDLEEQRTARLYAKVNRIKKVHKKVDADNVRHTLLLLEEKPIDRLRRALTRGQKFNFYRK